MVIVATADTIITGFGVWLIWGTLEHTRTSANAATETVKQARRQADYAEKQVTETRTIGQAQVRAYVSIPSISVEFFDFVAGQYHPKITIVARNDGDTPAKEYVWNPSVEYIFGEGRKKQRLLDTFQDSIGMMIPAKDKREDTVLVTPMDVEGFFREWEPKVRKVTTGLTPGVLVRVCVEFRYKDVFGNVIEDAAFFSGSFYKIDRDSGNLYVFGGPDWRTDEFSAMPRDWGDSKPEQPPQT